jgi:hypothetical protein
MPRGLEAVTSRKDTLSPLWLLLEHDPLVPGPQGLVYRGSALCRTSAQHWNKRLQRTSRSTLKDR